MQYIPEKPPEKAPKPKEEKKSDGTARLIIEVPAEAKLYIDDQPMKTTSARRTFSTPALEAGQTYYYILRAEVTREGKTQSETKRVLIRSGDTVRASFPELEGATSGKAVAEAGR
jgi:uncharacterized protein (TIGR03000 family)